MINRSRSTEEDRKFYRQDVHKVAECAIGRVHRYRSRSLYREITLFGLFAIFFDDLVVVEVWVDRFLKVVAEKNQ